MFAEVAAPSRFALSTQTFKRVASIASSKYNSVMMTFKSRCATSILWMMIAACASTDTAAASPSAPPVADQSSPKAAMISFWSALDRGDAETAKHLCVAGESQTAWIDGFASMCGEWRKMYAAREQKFGKHGAEHHTPAYSALAIAEKTVERVIDGETMLVMPDHPEHATIVVQKDGKWLLDMNRSMGGDLAATTNAHQMIAAAARKVAADTDAGKYASEAEAESAFKNALAQKLNLPQKPATQPAKQ